MKKFFFFLKDFPGRWGEVTRLDMHNSRVSATATSEVINEAFVAPTSTPMDSENSLRNRIRNLIGHKQQPAGGHKLLGEWYATSIAGNDISSSCLYTAGICAQKGMYNINFDDFSPHSFL